MQQGRVQVDADWNEQVANLLHYLQTLAEDLIGPHGSPVNKSGFEVDNITVEAYKCTGFTVSPGRYYVNGILCENSAGVSYTFEGNARLDFPFLVYLDVWERTITYIQDDSIREKALGVLGPDTAVRSEVVWQVKTHPLESGKDTCNDIGWDDLVEGWQPPNRGLLKARAKIDDASPSTEPCVIYPKSRYRGAENQLYRVEIHTGGQKKEATFKWSRENGSVDFPIIHIDYSKGSSSTPDMAVVILQHLGRDKRLGLEVGNWVEIVDDRYTLHQLAHPLWQVDKIDPGAMEVTLKREHAEQTYWVEEPSEASSTEHPLLRRWDQQKRNDLSLKEGAIPIPNGGDWITLEDGVQIQFPDPPSGTPSHTYRTGDYWLIPARTAMGDGDVEWPKDENGDPAPLPPHGIDHHYAPLAVVYLGDYKPGVDDCRCPFDSLACSSGDIENTRAIGADLLEN